MKCYFVINPIAGKKQKQQVFADNVREFFAKNGGEYEIYYTSKQGDAREYAKSLAQSGEKIKIFACGGEGTAFEVLNGIVGYDNVSLGVVPCGSANDFIKYFSEHEMFLDVPSQIDGEEFEIDLIKVGDYYAINSCSVGMDAMVGANMTKFKNLPLVSGKMSYVLALLYTLFSKLGVNLKVVLDGGKKTITKKALFAVIANAPYYGGGFYPTPAAKPFDEQLDFSVISVIPRLKILSLLKKYRAGTHVGLPICDIGRCEAAVIEADRSVPVNMDGEIIFTKKIEFEIVKKAIKLILPKNVAALWKEEIKTFAQVK
jgi:YegS/Rv2252/BmrU family lipid kinase